MRRLLPFLGVILLLFSSFSDGFTQRTCASHDHYEQMAASDPQFVINQQKLEEFTRKFIESGGAEALPRMQSTGPVYTIPVVFHVIYNTSAQNISDERIQAQLDVLNRDFQKLNSDWTLTPSVYQGRVADVQVQFCLAKRDPSGNASTGIIRRQTNVTSFSTNNAIKFTSQGGSDAWPRDSYLNFWVGNLSNNILGYAQFPGGSAATDGVVCHFNSVGGPNLPGGFVDYGIGRTATHEVGHWLNLRHIWGDGSCATDFVDDTPFHPSSNGGCPSSTLTTRCSQNRGALMMWMNFMDYTFDRCMYMFTNGQKDRMWAVMQPGGFRASLATSLGCTPPGSGTTCNAPAGLAVSNVTANSATLAWTTAANTTYNLEYKVSTSSTWTVVINAISPSTVQGLAANTTYNWRVTANCSGTPSTPTNGNNFTTPNIEEPPPGCTDAYEPNNTSVAAALIPLNQAIFAKICSTTDVDWYTFSNNNQNRAVRVTLGNSSGPGYNYEMRLYRPNGSLVGTTSSTNKVLTFSGNPTGAYRVEVFSTSGSSETAEYTLLAEIGSSFRDADAGRFLITGNEIRSFPNPAKDELVLQFGQDWHGTKAEVVMTDISGRRVQSTMVNATGMVLLNVRSLSTGFYLMQVSNGRLNQVEKIMIKK
jgi:hypothetical protein